MGRKIKITWSSDVVKFEWQMYLFPFVAITNYYELAGLNNTYLVYFWKSEVQFLLARLHYSWKL